MCGRATASLVRRRTRSHTWGALATAAPRVHHTVRCAQHRGCWQCRTSPVDLVACVRRRLLVRPQPVFAPRDGGGEVIAAVTRAVFCVGVSCAASAESKSNAGGTRFGPGWALSTLTGGGDPPLTPWSKPRRSTDAHAHPTNGAHAASYDGRHPRRTGAHAAS